MRANSSGLQIAPRFVIDVGGQVPGEPGEQDAAASRQIPGKPPRAVHGDHRLAGALPHPAPAPVRSSRVPRRRRCDGWRKTRQRSSGALSIASSSIDHHEAASRLVARQRGGEVSGVDRLRRRLPVPDELLVTVSRQEQEERLVRLQGKARLHGVHLGDVPYRTHLREHRGPNPEPGQLPITQLSEGAVVERERWLAIRPPGPRSRQSVRRKARTPAGRRSRG